jgi:acetylornithine/succinyldiaminopimelate/putrescine aminotransferase
VSRVVQLLKHDEVSLVHEVQKGYVNFYNPEAVMPYVPLAAKGPWIVTLHGAVIHDSGGYGMLGFGHNDERINASVSREHCMANIMTPALSQAEFFAAWNKQVGFSRPGGNPYARIMCLNSGSEAVELSARLTDVHAKTMTSKGGPHEGWRTSMMCLEGSFYGRTYRPARLSHSCRDIYQTHLASFSHPECHLPIVVKPNDVDGIVAAFEAAARNRIHIEALYMEPVMGEGQPGVALDRKFYDAARALTKKHHSLLMIDSIQAALRAKGALSVVDYPGFETAEAPDMETCTSPLPCRGASVMLRCRRRAVVVWWCLPSSVACSQCLPLPVTRYHCRECSRRCR